MHDVSTCGHDTPYNSYSEHLCKFYSAYETAHKCLKDNNGYCCGKKAGRKVADGQTRCTYRGTVFRSILCRIYTCICFLKMCRVRTNVLRTLQQHLVQLSAQKTSVNMTFCSTAITLFAPIQPVKSAVT